MSEVLTRGMLEEAEREICRPQEPGYIPAMGIPDEELYQLITHTKLKVLVSPVQLEYIKRRVSDEGNI